MISEINSVNERYFTGGILQRDIYRHYLMTGVDKRSEPQRAAGVLVAVMKKSRKEGGSVRITGDNGWGS